MTRRRIADEVLSLGGSNSKDADEEEAEEEEEEEAGRGRVVLDPWLSREKEDRDDAEE